MSRTMQQRRKVARRPVRSIVAGVCGQGTPVVRWRLPIEAMEKRLMLSGAAGGGLVIEWPVSEGGNGHFYALTSAALSFTDAEAQAVRNGGHLVAVNTKAEQTFIEKTFFTTPEDRLKAYWIGLTDAASEGKFVWTTKEAYAYNNFATDEPNNMGGNEDYVAINWHMSHGYYGDFGTWNDLDLLGYAYVGDNGLFGIMEFNSPRWALSGSHYSDLDGDRTRDTDEPGLNAWTVYLDGNGNGTLDKGEAFAVTDRDGKYAFAGLVAADYRLGVVGQNGWTQTTPASSLQVTLAAGSDVSGVEIGSHSNGRMSMVARSGPEFRANATTNSEQGLASIAIDADGDSLIAWQSKDQDGSGFGVYAQRYTADGQPMGNEFQANTYVKGDQWGADVAMNGNGESVITWFSAEQDGSGDGIYAQRYDAAGAKVGNEFRVNTTTAGDQSFPEAAMNDAGAMVITWTAVASSGNGTGIYAQCYDATGAKRGGELRANSAGGINLKESVVALDADGDFVVAWWRYDANKGYGIYSQRYNSAAAKVASEFRVNVGDTGPRTMRPSVAIDRGGGFIVVWESQISFGGSWDIFAQRYNASGQRQGSEFRVNTSGEGDQFDAAVAMNADGDTVVTWSSYGQDGDQAGVYAQRYSGDGQRQADELAVNSWTKGAQCSSAVAVDTDGDFAVTWSSENQDGDSWGVYAQRYDVAKAPDVVIEGTGGDDVFRVVRQGDELRVYVDDLLHATPAAKFSMSSLNTVRFSGLDQQDSVIVDFAGGDLVPAGGLSFDGGGGWDSLVLRGMDASHSVAIDRTGVVYGESKISTPETEWVRLDSEAGQEIAIGSLTIGSSCLAGFAAGNGKVLRTKELAIGDNSMLDLGGNRLIVEAAAENRDAVLVRIGEWVGSARGARSGQWIGLGITSGEARLNPLTGLAVAVNDRGGQSLVDPSADRNAIVVVYTWNGDANLDGVVNADDYFRIDSGFITQAKGYQNGDFNYDGLINADDYFLIDSAYIGQSGPLAASKPESAVPADVAVQQKAKKADADGILSQLFSTEPVL